MRTGFEVCADRCTRAFFLAHMSKQISPDGSDLATGASHPGSKSAKSSDQITQESGTAAPLANLAQSLRSETNRRAFDYWMKLRGDRSMPARSDIDPLDIRDILPHVLLLDVAHDPLDFRYRLIGTKVVSHLNNNHSGKWMSEIPHQKPPSVIWSSCAAVVTEKLPMTTEIPYMGRNKDFAVGEDIVMPLSNDDDLVNMLFVSVDFFRRTVEPV